MNPFQKSYTRLRLSMSRSVHNRLTKPGDLVGHHANHIPEHTSTQNKSMNSQKQGPEHNTINEANLNALVGGILHDLGGAFSVPLVQIGESLGLYQTLSENGALSCGELAAKTGLKERYLREW